jgi:hypothetical protein
MSTDDIRAATERLAAAYNPLGQREEELRDTLLGTGPPPPPPPPPPQGRRPIQHCIWGNKQLNFFLANPDLVEKGDLFMVLSANEAQGHRENIDVGWLNEVGRKLHDKFDGITCLATCSSDYNVTKAVNGVNRQLYPIIMEVYEPANPQFTWDKAKTRQHFQRFAKMCRDKGFKAWAKPTGRGTVDRREAGKLSYKDLFEILDGQNIQTQRSAQQKTFRRAMDDLLSQQRAAGGNKPFTMQVGFGSGDINHSPMRQSFDQGKIVWEKMPPIVGLTMWSANTTEMRKFLNLRRQGSG